MDVETAIALADQLIFAKTGKPMNDLQRLIFQGAWQGKSFTEIHRECADRCGLGHLMRNVGPELWQLLSEVVGTRVTKNSLQGAISLAQRHSSSKLLSHQPSTPTTTISQESEEFPASRLYIDRHPYEAECYEAISKPGALIRIKAPQEMGKTYLMQRILAHAKQKGYRTHAFSFDLSDSTVLTDLNTFSRWFCASVGQALGLPNQLSHFWQDIFGCNYNSTLYFENYLLAEIASPLVLALDKVDLVFERPAIANDFCSLLRGWHQRAAQGDAIAAIWQNLRLIVVHSTEIYGALDINHSPLGGVGLVIKLPELNPAQVQELADKHQLNWELHQIEQLMALVGGHPYLIQQGLDQIARKDLTLDQLLKTAATEAGSYSNHLRRHLWHLQQQPTLATTFKQVITADHSIQLDTNQAFKLESMGLVHLKGNDVVPRCELYRQYFRDRL